MRKFTGFFILILFLLSSCAVRKPLAKTKVTVNRLTDVTQRQFDYYFYEGIRFRDNKEFDKALETFRMCVAIDSLDAGAQSEVGLMYASLGLNKEALKYLETSVKLQPDNWWYNLQLLSLQTRLKNWKRAIEIITDVQKIYPNKPEVYNIETSLYRETKNYKSAVAALDKLETLTGIDESLSIEKSQLYRLDNNLKKSIDEINKLINKFPSESKYRVYLGTLYMEQNLTQQAFDIYQQVLTEDPSNPTVYVSLSDYYKTVNEPEKAQQSIMSALKNEQLEIETKIEVLGQYVENMMQDTTKLDETESLFKLLVDRYPMEEQVHSYYALFLQYRNRKKDAMSELESMVNINPKNEQTWIRMIQLNLSGRNFEELKEITNRAIANVPTVSTWYFYKGIAQFQTEDYEGALSTYKTGLKYITVSQNSQKSDFHAQIGDIYFKLNSKDSAFVYYEKSLEANPKNSMVMNNYAYYLSLEKKDLKKAENMSAKTVEQEPKNSTYLDTYAWILYQEGLYSLAKFYIERAIDNLSKDVDSAVIYEHYGDILWMSGKEDGKYDAKAVEMWQKSYDAGNKTPELKLKIENKGWKRL